MKKGVREANFADTFFAGRCGHRAVRRAAGHMGPALRGFFHYMKKNDTLSGVIFYV